MRHHATPEFWRLFEQLPETVREQAVRNSWKDDVTEVAYPKLTARSEPIWPVNLRTSPNSGTVVLKVLVDRDAVVRDIEVIKTVSRPMDEEAIRAVKQWRFRPAVYRGAPVAVWIQVTVSFQLGGVSPGGAA